MNGKGRGQQRPASPRGISPRGYILFYFIIMTGKLTMTFSLVSHQRSWIGRGACHFSFLFPSSFFFSFSFGRGIPIIMIMIITTIVMAMATLYTNLNEKWKIAAAAARANSGSSSSKNVLTFCFCFCFCFLLLLLDYSTQTQRSDQFFIMFQLAWCSTMMCNIYSHLQSNFAIFCWKWKAINPYGNK